MAKKKPATLSLLDEAATLPAHRNARTWVDQLSAEQRAEYKALVEHMRKQSREERPNYTAIVGIIRKHFGTAPSESTLRRAVYNE